MSEGYDVASLFNRIHRLLLSADEAGTYDYKGLFLLAITALDILKLSDQINTSSTESPYIQLLEKLREAEKQGFEQVEEILKEDIRKAKSSKVGPDV